MTKGLEADAATEPTETEVARRRLIWAGVWAALALVVIAFIVASGMNLARIVISGIQDGAVYGLVALGIVLVYKATRILNFAQGEFGTVAALIALTFFLRGDIGAELITSPSLGEMIIVSLAVIAIGAGIGALVNVLVVERLARANELTALVATVGVMIVFIVAGALTFELRVRRYPRYLDGAPCFGPETAEGAAFGLCPLTIGGLPVTWHTVIVAMVLAVTAVVLAAFFRTRVGVALLATSQEPFAAQLQGISPRAMATLAWAGAGALGAVGGLLGGGIFQSVQPAFGTSTLLIPAFTAAVLGGITSMVGAVVGGLILGLVVAFATATILAFELTGVVPGVPQAATLVVLLAVLLLRPRGLFGKEA